MKKIVTLLLAVLINSAVHGESVKLAQLRTQKDAAIERALEPIEEKYKTALQELLKVLTASEDLEGALEVKKEINEPKKRTAITDNNPGKEYPRLELLRDQRDTAIDRVTEPILSKYIEELEKMQRAMTRSGKLEEAVEVKNELAAIQGAAGGNMTPIGDESGFTEELIGTSWELKQAGETILLKFEDGTFQIHKKTADGNYIPGDTRAWTAENPKRRQIRIFWHYGEEIATLNSKMTTMKDTKHVMERISE